MTQKAQKNLLTQDLKLETKIPGTFFTDFTLFFNIAEAKFGRKIIWSSWSSRKRIFFAKNIPLSGPNFRNSIN